MFDSQFEPTRVADENRVTYSCSAHPTRVTHSILIIIIFLSVIHAYFCRHFILSTNIFSNNSSSQISNNPIPITVAVSHVG